MAEISSYTPSYDYSTIGSVGGEAAQSVNGDMINKIRAGEEKSVINPIVEDIDNLTLEREKLDEIKTAIGDFEDMVSYFDLFNEENVFNQYHFDTSGTSAAFDSVDMSQLKEGTITVDVTQIGQKDVYQSNKLEDITPESNISFGQTIGQNLSVQVGGDDAYEFTMYNLDDDGNIESAKTYEELVAEIDSKDDLQASLEAIGTDGDGDPIYRLIIKSAEPGENNALTISQNGIDLGFGDTVSKSVSDEDWANGPGEGSLFLNGTEIIGTLAGLSYDQVIERINDDTAVHGFTATKDSASNRIIISHQDGSEVEASGNDNLTFSSGSQTLQAQNMKATIDGVEYDVSSNSITTQGSLKITGLELGVSTITISKDTSAVTVAAEALVTNYNSLQTMLTDEIYADDSVIEDKAMLRGILSDIKGMFFQNYGAKTPEYGDEVDEYGDIVKGHSNVTNNTISIFALGFELDKSGNLSVDTEAFNEIVNRTKPEYFTDSNGDLVKKMDFDDLKNVFTGEYTNKGLGVQLKEYLDALDGYQGTFYNYDIEMIDRQADLEQDKEDELARLDAKYGIMAEQFSAYSAIIAQMEASFSGLKMMIEQSTNS